MFEASLESVVPFRHSRVYKSSCRILLHTHYRQLLYSIYIRAACFPASVLDSYNSWPVCSFKQFVATNCSKERTGSIVNESLKHGILIIIDTPSESDFYADFKYIRFIKFSLIHQKMQA